MTTNANVLYAPIPRVSGLPVLGSLPELRRNRLDFLLRVSRECGDIGRFRAGPRTMFFVNTSELVYAVLVEHAGDVEKAERAFKGEGPLSMLGNGLLTSPNDLHRRQRKLIAPHFQPRHVRTYAATMAGYAEELQRSWVDGATVDVAHEMAGLTLWIAGKVLFDADLRDEAAELGAALTTAMRLNNKRRTALVRVPSTWPTPRNRRVRAAAARLDATVCRIIAERRRSGEQRGDLLSLLLSAQDEHDGSFMTDAQVRDEAMTLFLAGHETTANALAWTLYLLARHPDVYARVRAEGDSVLGGRTPSADDLAALPYTLQVLKESMRLYPPAYLILRYAVRAFEVCGHRLPAHALIMISPYTLHRRADYFPDPDRFDPGRFTPGAEQRLPRYAYLPFGAGPRACIGNHFALMEAHLVLATLIQRVTFDLLEGQHVGMEPLVTLRPKPGIAMTVRRREAPTR